jgi:poly(3-hydroxyalkanoate) depolymerase
MVPARVSEGFNSGHHDVTSPRRGAFLFRREDDDHPAVRHHASKPWEVSVSETATDAPRQRWAPYKVRVGDLDLRVAHRGEGQPPLLLITGIGAHLDMWEPFESLLEGREIIAFDAPGTGESSRSRLPLRMEGLANVVGGLLDELGHDEVDMLGISFGGAVAQQFAHQFPDRVRRLILCATSPGIVSVPPKPLPALFLMSPARYYHPKIFRFMMPRIVGGVTARDPSVLAAQCGPRLSRPPDPLGYMYQLYATMGWTSVHWLHNLKQPTLVLAGDNDHAIPLVNAKLLARRIPNARLHVVEDGGHLFLLDEPLSVIDEIHAFLDEE